uniref:Tick transposon n=1 Tax=Rhipicephalus appendiculatus TaxID=34631 RepID=A0A131YWL5_RHIAP
MGRSFPNQVSRLEAAGLPRSVITAVAESLLQKFKRGTREAMTATQPSRISPQVVPYIHKLSHNFKKVAGRHGVSIVFSAPEKIGKLCQRICDSKKRGCEKKRERHFVKCSTGVVYSIPLSCGKVYIGQTERCVHDRLREHAQKLTKRDDKYAHLVAHAILCGCNARFSETKILGRSTRKTAREVLEAFFIENCKDSCVSAPSLSLFPSESQFISSRL